MSVANSSMEQHKTRESGRTMLIKFEIALCEMKSAGLAWSYGQEIQG